MTAADGGGGGPSRDGPRRAGGRFTVAPGWKLPPPPLDSSVRRRPTTVPACAALLTRLVPTWHGSCHVPGGDRARGHGPSTATTCRRGSSTPSWTSSPRAMRHVDAGGRRAGRHQRAHAVPLLRQPGTSCSATPPDGSTAACWTPWSDRPVELSSMREYLRRLWTELAGSMLAVRVQHDTPEGRQLRTARLAPARERVDAGLPPSITGASARRRGRPHRRHLLVVHVPRARRSDGT